MVGKIFLFMLSFIGVMVSGPVLATLAIFIFKVDFDRLLVQHAMMINILFALYGIFVVLMYFRLQDVIMVFKPAVGVRAVSKSELLNRLEESFNTPVQGQRLFDFKADKDRVVITWAASINYFQGTSAGGRGMKRVIVLTLDENKHDAFFIMKDKDWGWDVSTNFFDFSLNYSAGIFVEYRTEVHPSIVFSEKGGLDVDMKKLTYNSNDLWKPIETAMLSSGWTLRGGMVPKLFHRMLFSIPVGLLFFGMAFFITYLAGLTPPKGSDIKTPVVTKEQNQAAYPDPAAQIRKTIPHLTAENLQIILEGLMKTPPDYLNQEIKTAFAAYAWGYLSKKNKKEAFVLRLKDFARTNKINNF
jgi:hypothetical protein